MTLERKIFSNSAINIVCNILSVALKFLAIYLIINYFSSDKESFGKYTFITSFITILSIIIDLGVNSITIREISNNRSLLDHYLSNAIVLKIALGFIVYILSIVIILVFHYFQPSKYNNLIIGLVAFSSLTFFILALSQSFEMLFRIELKMIFVGIANVVGGLVFFLTTYFFIKKGYQLSSFIFNWVLMFFIIMFLLLIFTLGRFKFSFKVDFTLIKKIFLLALPLGLSAAFGFIYYRIDTIMLSWFKGDESVANYGVAHKFVEISDIIPASLMVVVFPLMSRFYKEDINKLKILYRRSIDWMLLLGFPMAVIVSMNSDKFILIFRQQYLVAHPALRILIWAAFMTFPGHILGSMIIALHRQRAYPIITGLGVIINVTLNLILIPKFDFIGAAITAFITELIMLSLFLFVVYKAIGESVLLSSLFRYIFASGLIGVIIYGCRIYDVNIFKILIICIIVYGLILLLMRDDSLKGLIRMIKESF